MIKPTVGRIVHYWPFGQMEDGSNQPHAAIVTFVHSDRMVNLCAHNDRGHAYGITSIPLLQDDDEPPIGSSVGYATWMEYQKEQAAKVAGS